jgi:hypothetical protein
MWMLMKIRNKELQKLYTISGIFLSIGCLLLTLLVSYWFNIGLLLVVAILTSSTGVEFDIETKRYRKYTHFSFWTSGEWKNIGENKELVILVKSGIQTTSGTMMTGSLETKLGFSELYLMDESHLRRFFIDSSENHTSIEKLAGELSGLLKLEINPYQPRRKK